MEKISHIDSFTESALQYAQLFKRESVYYFAACALCLVSMGVAGIMSAQLWIGENKKRIFTLHTAGYKHGTIIAPALKMEFVTAACAILVGGFDPVSGHPGLENDLVVPDASDDNIGITDVNG